MAIDLIGMLAEGISFSSAKEHSFRRAAIKGERLFQEYNQSRMRLAFELLNEDMRHALYELIFFLHVNDVHFQKVSFQTVSIERISGIVRESRYSTSMNLYSPGAPSGVVGFDALPSAFYHEFYQYISRTFHISPQQFESPEHCSIVSISSPGSTGTICQKPEHSDLDIQILYDLNPIQFDPSEWGNDRLKAVMTAEMQWTFEQLMEEEDTPTHLIDKMPNLHQRLMQKAAESISHDYPLLYQALFHQKFFSGKLDSPKGIQFKKALTREMIHLIRHHEVSQRATEHQQAARLLKQRVRLLQNYLRTKFPYVDLSLFVCDTESFKQGQHGTTLESQEASGSAYELILNHEVLLPAVEFLPVVPAHMILPKSVSNYPEAYAHAMDYLSFNCIPCLEDVHYPIVDKGDTAAPKLFYILSHVGAAYWESFKAASGNLPKALLNLLRLETLHHPQYLSTIIQLVKSPELLNASLQNSIDYQQSLQKGPHRSKRGTGMALEHILELEELFPMLMQDPWWLKYKVLKIFYLDPEIPIDLAERRRVSRNVDLCFALHLRIVDAFAETKEGQKLNLRDKFLRAFCERAFPQGSAQREHLESILVGTIQALQQLERDLRDLFSNCLDRIHRWIAFHDVPDSSHHEEFEIWFHYYRQNFDLRSDEVRRNILSHLRVPKPKIHISYHQMRRRGSWVFHASTSSTVESSKERSFSTVKTLASHVDLTYEKSFLKGLAHCIVNGYYGLIQEGSLQERKSLFEVDLSEIDLESAENHWALVDSASVMRIADQIVATFPYQKPYYLDCVRGPKKVESAFFFLNLFHFGRLSVLYRDTHQQWHVEEFDHASIAQRAQTYYDSYQKLLEHKALHRTIGRFLRKHELDLSEEGLRLAFWYNAASSHTTSSNLESREKNLSSQFKEIVLKQHIKKKMLSVSNADEQILALRRPSAMRREPSIEMSDRMKQKAKKTQNLLKGEGTKVKSKAKAKAKEKAKEQENEWDFDDEFRVLVKKEGV